MPTGHPQLSPTSERYRETLTDSSRQRAMDIPFQVAANEIKAVMKWQVLFVGN